MGLIVKVFLNYLDINNISISPYCVKAKSIKKIVPFLAEREGFEPSVQPKLYNGFRDHHLKPLGHLSNFKIRT